MHAQKLEIHQENLFKSRKIARIEKKKRNEQNIEQEKKRIAGKKNRLE